jgi:hypothetical protein
MSGDVTRVDEATARQPAARGWRVAIDYRRNAEEA